MSDKGLFDKLIEYKEKGKYPLHMPGHKREERLFEHKREFLKDFDPYEIDITEIDGFDNLHHPKGIIKAAMDNAADFFGTEKTWFLVNGSSCGLLAAIHAVTDIGDYIVIGRNCHKAVYNAVELRNLSVDYIYPQIISEYGIHGGYKPGDIEEILIRAKMQGKKVKTVVITSPTYEGIVSDIQSIASIVHKYESILIVDEAHGAHLGIHEKMPKSACQLGADIVIESAHKTLPAMTQTAFLHLCSDRVASLKIQQYLAVYQTSSPSYVLMGSMDKCVRELQENGKERLEQLLITLENFYQKTGNLKHIKVPGKELAGKNGVFDFDVSKVLIFSNSGGLNGKDLEKILREKYAFEIEMASAGYVLAMTSLCDDMKQILRLADALEEIDADIEQCLCKKSKDRDRRNQDIKDSDKNKKFKKEFANLPADSLAEMSIYEAMRKKAEMVEIEKAEGRISAGYVYVYPPEIPLIVPGEVITGNVIDSLVCCYKMGLNIKGMENESIRVIIS